MIKQRMTKFQSDHDDRRTKEDSSSQDILMVGRYGGTLHGALYLSLQKQ